MALEKNEPNFRMRKIVWIGFLQGFLPTPHIQVLKHLAERGHEVSLITVHSKKKALSDTADIRLISIPLRYVPLVSNAIYVLVLLLIFPLLVLYLKPDFILASAEDGTAFGLVSTLLIPRPKRPKIVLDIRSTPVETVGLRGSLTELCFGISVRMASRLFDGITIVTHLMKREISNKFHIDPRSIEVWTNGVPTALFNPRKYTAKGMELKRTIGLYGKFVIIYHGGLDRKRGILETIDGISLLGNNCRDVVLFVLGYGPALSDFKSLVQRKGIQERVHIHEPVDYEDVPAYIMISDVAIVPLPDMPDWRNQCPLKLLECLSMEKVVIATDIPANREVIGESKCGIYASSSKPQEIAKAILYAFDNREKLRKWGHYGRRIVEEKYDYARVAGVLERYLLRL